MKRTISEIRNEIKARLIEDLRRDVARLPPDTEFHLIGSFATENEWDGLSDVDIVCISAGRDFNSTHFPSVDRPKDVLNFTPESLAKNAAFSQAVSQGARL
jgi:predicted nucleotidyltransferase